MKRSPLGADVAIVAGCDRLLEDRYVLVDDAVTVGDVSCCCCSCSCWLADLFGPGTAISWGIVDDDKAIGDDPDRKSDVTSDEYAVSTYN